LGRSRNRVATFTGDGVDETRLYAGKPASISLVLICFRGEEKEQMVKIRE